MVAGGTSPEWHAMMERCGPRNFFETWDQDLLQDASQSASVSITTGR